MQTLFDYSESTKRRDAGAAQVLGNNDAWRESALVELERLARRMPEFTADDLREAMAEQPKHFNAWGALFLSAARKGWIERTDRVRRSSRVAAHAHTNLVWRSLLWEGA